MRLAWGCYYDAGVGPGIMFPSVSRGLSCDPPAKVEIRSTKTLFSVYLNVGQEEGRRDGET